MTTPLEVTDEQKVGFYNEVLRHMCLPPEIKIPNWIAQNIYQLAGQLYLQDVKSKNKE